MFLTDILVNQVSVIRYSPKQFQISERLTCILPLKGEKKKDVQVSDPTVALERPVLVMEAKETGEGVQSKIHNPNLQSKTGNNYAQEGGQSESKEQAP